MPELPEVETVRRGLDKLIVGKQVSSVEFDWPKGFPNSKTDIETHLIGARVSGVNRRAKVLMIELDTGYTLLTHLKMTGQLVYVGAERFGAGHPSKSLVGDLPDKSTRVILTFTDKSTLYFNDQRKFGWMRLMPTVEVPNIDFMKKVGPEPLEDSFTPNQFVVRIRKRANTSVKAALLDQTVVAGVGNIYADESLFAARIHPSTKVKDVKDSELKKLLVELKKVLLLSIEKGGSTDRNYVNAEGKKGSYIDFAQVFRLEGKPCSRCGTTLEKIKVAGRGTHVCPKCQRLR